jgi:RNA polymerase sigma-70 factor (ECF subfamily)
MRPVLGADRVSRLWVGLGAKYGTDGGVRFVDVNGSPGVILYRDGAVYGVLSFALRAGRIAGVYAVLNPHKLAHVRAAEELAAPDATLAPAPKTPSPPAG